MVRSVAGSVVAVLLLAGSVRAEEDPLRRTPEAWKVLRTPWRTLRVRPEWTLYFRPWGRTGTDPFPYVLAATDEMRTAGHAVAVRPEHFGRYVTRETLATPEGALEAVRFFVAGRVVPDASAARRVLEEAARLSAEPTKAGAVVVQEHPGDGADLAPSVVRAADGTFAVRFLALETDLEIALVRVRARVDPGTGAVTIERDVLVKGPLAVVLFCPVGGDMERLQEEVAARQAAVDGVRRALRAALDPRRTRERVRALAKPGVTMESLRRALGAPDDDVGSGVHLWVFALDEGAALVAEAGNVRAIALLPSVPGSPFEKPGDEERLFP
jgi:hypothetical protein